MKQDLVDNQGFQEDNLTFEDKISILGNKFRGLWQSCEILDNELTKDMWCVTFVYKGKYVETPLKKTINEAIDFAINKSLSETFNDKKFIACEK